MIFQAVAELRRIHELAVSAAAKLRTAATTVKPLTSIQVQQEPSIDDSGSPYWPPLVAIDRFREAADVLMSPDEFWEFRQAFRQKLIEQRKNKLNLGLKENRKAAAVKEVAVADPSLEMYVIRFLCSLSSVDMKSSLETRNR